jgi:hypothetical protein
MFAKKARSLNFSRSFGLRRNAAAARPSNDNRTNDNQPVRLVAPWRRKRRPVLFCRWQCTAGRLECHWVHERPDLSDEGISYLAGQARHRGGMAMLAA